MHVVGWCCTGIGSAEVARKRTELGLKMIIGLPIRHQMFLPFVVSPIPFRLEEWQRLNATGGIKPHSSRHKQHAIQVALEWQEMLKTDATLTLAQIARNIGISRARVTQIMSLLQLPSGILDFYKTKNLSARLFKISTRKLRDILTIKSTEGKMDAFHRLKNKERAQSPNCARLRRLTAMNQPL